MIRQLYEHNWSSSSSLSGDDDDGDDKVVASKPLLGVLSFTATTDDEQTHNIYMIHDIKVKAWTDSKITIQLSLINEYGQKVFKVIKNDIFFDLYVEAITKEENISALLGNLHCFDNTPQYIDNKYTAMGYTTEPLKLWRININQNKLQYINDFCLSTHRQMFINTDLNDALPLVQKNIGIYVKMPANTNQYIPYGHLMRPSNVELSNKCDYICRKLSIDIEVLTPPTWTLFPEASERGCEIIIIACTFQHNDLPYETTILYTDYKDRTVTIAPTDGGGVKRTFIMFRNEYDMLQHFIEMINPFNTDLITGWNVRNFDLKYIYDRCVKFYPQLCEKFVSWTLDGSQMTFKSVTRKGQNVTLIDCFGIIILDMCDYNKSNVKAKSYKLKNIAKTFLRDDKQKLDIDYKDISRFYTDGNDKEFSHLLQYCSVDAEIVLDLMTVQKVWPNTVCMADICHVPMNYVINHGLMQRNICMISQFINESTDYLLPYKFERPFTEYKGGFVNEPIVGFHSSPVFVLDFNSLYPTTMLAFNICTTTIVKVSDILDELPPQLQLEFQPDELSDLVFTQRTTQISAAPYMNNVGFVASHNRKGVMPQILENLLKQRKCIQLECKQTTCPIKRKQLDAQQLSYKLCANAIYGLLGCSFSPLYNPDVAASVTSFGRFLSHIKRKRILEYMEADGITGSIIYGDTDSVMIGVQNKSIAEVKCLAIDYAERVTKSIGINPIKTEYEKIFCPFLIHKKKHYIGVMYTDNCEQYDRIEYKGNEMVRSDNCSLTTNVMRCMIDILFFYGDGCIDAKCQQIDVKLRELLADWSTLYRVYNDGGLVDRSLLESVVHNAVYSKKLTKEVYKNRLPHVAVYERVKNRKQYHIGDRIVYCIANTEFTDKVKPKNIIEMAYDIDEFLESEERLYLSIHYYLHACIRKPLYRLFETLDERYKNTLEMTLSSSFPPLNHGPPKKRAKNSKTIAGISEGALGGL